MATAETDDRSTARTVELVLMDDVSGALLTIVVSRGVRVSLDRALLFLADGVTLWFNAGFGDAGHRPDLSWTTEGRAQRVRVSAHTSEDLEPAEHLAEDSESAAFRVPLTLDLVLEPLSLPVPRQRPFTDGGLQGSQVFRASGTVAAGSVIYRVEGQAWVGERSLGAHHDDDGARLQAAFQDGSSLLATAPQTPDGVGPAALQRHTATESMTVSTFRIDGPARRVPLRMICQLDGDPGVTVLGSYRSLDQHVAFVQEREGDEGWVRRAYTPFDVAYSGITGFGVLEQVEHVSSPDAPPVVGTGIPETF
ncbi:hypothetical protein [Mumia sp. Pv 4-285]|uniref:hypothetical protein n=1 Tax=Mumia qirimensis TaxID=3234852 RepID=UPI00351D173D